MTCFLLGKYFCQTVAKKKLMKIEHEAIGFTTTE